MGCLELIKAIETELVRKARLYKAGSGNERAILVSVTTAPKYMAMESLAELKELALSSDINVLDIVVQQRRRVDSKFLMGIGKFQELIILILRTGATLIVFDQDLNPSQMRSISSKIDIKIIDRTQLILDIFAQRAQTREGKLQVELAQLRYLLPRLIAKSTAMSRLTGGIGGRGPGETKLEIHRRRVRDRIARLEKDVLVVKKQRKQQRARRQKRQLPVISIIGYTNAGKSTLLNTLTRSNVKAENRLFATLDPSSRRLRLPRDVEVIITDTVGFIKNLPKDLMAAFHATFEELENADLLLHVIDISNPRFKDHIKSVEKILCDLNLNDIPLICVLNKRDLVDPEFADIQTGLLKGVSVSAKNKSTLGPLIKKIQALISS
jgi:GTP-binding protein HflX